MAWIAEEKVNCRSDPKLKNVKILEHSSFRLFAAQKK